MRFEAFAFRLTILLTALCVLLACTLAWSASNDSNDARPRAAQADSAINSIARRCKEAQPANGSRVADILWGIDSTYCAGSAGDYFEAQSELAHSVIQANEKTAAQAMIVAVVAPFLLFGIFYVIRWLFTGRVTPLWPLRKAASPRD